MAFVTVFQGVVFIEGDHPRAVKRYSAETSMNGVDAQLRNINDLKQTMANIAKNCGCNCVVNFVYGQKAKLFAWDDVAFYGNGYYALLSPEDYQSIVSQFV